MRASTKKYDDLPSPHKRTIFSLPTLTYPRFIITIAIVCIITHTLSQHSSPPCASPTQLISIPNDTALVLPLLHAHIPLNQKLSSIALPIIADPVDVIFGVAEGVSKDPKGYGVPGLTKFMGSLFRTGFDGYVIIATDGLSDHHTKTQFMKKFGREKVFFLDVGHYRVGRFQNLHAKELRYYLYRRWASQFVHNETRILVTDVRDVYFQKNPFDSHYFPEETQGRDLYLFEESEAKTLGTSAHCGKWIQTCFGRDVLTEIGDKRILCSGTSMGSPSGLITYTSMMLDAIASPQSLENCHTPLHDQAFHNYLYYQGMLSKKLSIHVFQQGEGPANNIGISPVYANAIDVENKVLYNRDGYPSALVHQYDRHEPLLIHARSLMIETVP